MAVKHKKIVNKKKRASGFAKRLKDELELVDCTPVLTGDEAEQVGAGLLRNQIGFYLEAPGVGACIPVNRKLFFSPNFDEEDEAYFIDLVTRMWLGYLRDRTAALLKLRFELERVI